MDLFSLYVLFSHFRPRDVTLGNSFFQMWSYTRSHVCITYEKTKGKFHWEHTWFEMGKQKVQATGSARVFGYTVKRGFLNRVYGILQLKYGYSVYHVL